MKTKGIKGFFQREAEFMAWSWVAVIALGLVGGIVIPRILKGPCSNRIVHILPSPEGSLKAIVFLRDCGATTDFNTHISVLRANNSEPKGSGNAFVADSDHGRAMAGEWGGPNVSLAWEGVRRLAVTYARGSRVFAKHDEVLGVHIEYAEAEGTAPNPRLQAVGLQASPSGHR
jgi:hypothetical protein